MAFPCSTSLARLFLAAVVVGVTCLAGWASAQPRPPADPVAIRRAEAIAIEAKALFQNRNYAEAAQLFLQAWQISGRAALMYNAARAHEEAGLLKRAEALFRQYLTLPDADDQGKADALSRADALRRRIEEAERRAVTEPPPSRPAVTTTLARAPPAATAAPSRWPLWTGIAGGAVAGGLYAWAWARASALDAGTVRDDAARQAYASGRDAASAMRWGAAGLGVVSAGLAGWGWWRGRPAAAVALVPTPGGVEFVVGGRLPSL